MCKMLEDMRNEAVKASLNDVAIRLIKKEKMSLEEIADSTGLSLEAVEELERQVMQMA